MPKRRRAILGSLLCLSALSSKIEACTTTSNVASKSDWEAAVDNFNAIGGDPYCVNFSGKAINFGSGNADFARATGSMHVDGKGTTLTATDYTLVRGGVDSGTIAFYNMTLGSGVNFYLDEGEVLLFLDSSTTITDMSFITLVNGQCQFAGTKTLNGELRVVSGSFAVFGFDSGASLTLNDLMNLDDLTTFQGPTPGSGVTTPILIANESIFNASRITIENMTLQVKKFIEQGGTIFFDGGTLSVAHSGTVGGGGITVEVAGGQIEVPSGFSPTLSNSITGSSITKTGPGTLTLTNTANNQSGLVVSAGTIAFSNAAVLGAGQITLSEATLQATATTTLSRGVTLSSSASAMSVNSGVTFTCSGAITGSGRLNKSGAGTLALTSGSNAYTGGVEILQGTLSISSQSQLGSSSSAIGIQNGAILSVSANNFTLSNPLTLTSSGSISTASGVTTTYSGLITGAQLIKADVGTLVLSNLSNSYTGGTSITGGILSAVDLAAINNGVGGLTFASGTRFNLTGSSSNTLAHHVTLNGAATIDNTPTLTITGTISGSGSLTKTGAGTLVLGSTSGNTYTGGTIVQQGTLEFSLASQVSTGAITASGGALNLLGTMTLANPLALSATTNITTQSTVTLSGAISGAGQLNKYGAGTLILTSTSNTYAGTSIFEGVLQVSDDRQLGAGMITLESTLALAGSDTFAQGMTLSGTLGTISVASGLTPTWSGIISGGTLNKTGPGTLTLTAANTYSATNIEAGVLAVSSQAALRGTVTLVSGSTLRLTSHFSPTNDFVVSAGNGRIEILNGGSFITSGSLTGPGSLTFGSQGGTQATVTVTSSTVCTLGTISLFIAKLVTEGTNVLEDTVISLTPDTNALFDLSNFTSSDVTVGNLTGGGSVILGSNTLFLNTSTSPAACSAIISGSGGLVIEGSGMTTLSGANTFEGGVQLVGNSSFFGSLGITQESALGTNTIISCGGGGLQAVETLTLSAAKTLSLQEDTFTHLSAASLKVFTIDSRLTGDGAITIDGPGTVYLTNTSNNYKGGTKLSGGVLLATADAFGSGSFIGEGGTFQAAATETTNTVTLSQDISLDADTTTLFNADENVTLEISGEIGGFGSFATDGPGTIVFSRIKGNSYDGKTFIRGGVLSISDGNQIEDSSLVELGATLRITAITSSTGDILVLSNAILETEQGFTLVGDLLTDATKPMPLTVSGGGTLTLAGMGGYSGGFLIKSATALKISEPLAIDGSDITLETATLDLDNNNLTIGNLSATGSSEVLLGNGFLTITTSVASSCSAAIKNSGGVIVDVIVDGTGSLTLTAVNTFEGGLTLAGGTLSVSSDTSLGEQPTTKNPDLGPITGSGGTLQATASFTTARDFYFIANTTTTFDVLSSVDLTLTGTVDGDCGVEFVKSGAGTLNINGVVVECTAVATSAESSLRASPSSISAATPSTFPSILVSQGVLGGSGSIGSVTVAPDAAVQGGGASIGTLSILGDLTLQPGAVLGVRLDPARASVVDMTGVMTIEPGALVLAVPLPGNYNKPVTFTIAEALSNVVGRFATADVMPGFFLSATLSYPTSTTVQLNITPIQLSSLVKGANAVSTAKALSKIVDRNRAAASPSGAILTDVILSLVPFVSSTSQMTYAMNQLHPALFKAMQVVQEAASVQVRESLSVRMQEVMNCKFSEKAWNIWVNGLGNILNQHSDSYAKSPQVGYRSAMGGFTAGSDYHFARYFYVGALGGFTSAHMHYKENQGYGDVNSGYGGLYFSAISEMFYGNISTIGGWSGYQAHRKIHYPGVSMQAKNHHGGRELLSHADTGVNLKWGRFTLRPFDSLDYISQKEDGFGEKGAGQWNLSVQKSHSIFLRNELGLQFASCFCLKNATLSIAPKLSWVREVRIKGSTYRSAFREAEAFPFTVTGYFPDRSLISPGLLITSSMLEDRLTLSAYYEGEFKGNYSANRLGGEVRYAY